MQTRWEGGSSPVRPGSRDDTLEDRQVALLFRDAHVALMDRPRRPRDARGGQRVIDLLDTVHVEAKGYRRWSGRWPRRTLIEDRADHARAVDALLAHAGEGAQVGEARSSGGWSILKSPVTRTLPASVRTKTTSASGIEWRAGEPEFEVEGRGEAVALSDDVEAQVRQRCSRSLEATRPASGPNP